MRHAQAKLIGGVVIAAIVITMVARTVVRSRDDGKHGEMPDATVVQRTNVPAVKAAERGGAMTDTQQHGAVVTGGDAGVAATNADTKARARIPYSEDQKKVMEMEALVDDGDEAGALEIARKLIKSDDADVRSDVVDTLGWIGVKALPELTMMLADSDQDVVDEAQRKWLEILDEVDDPQAQADLLKAAMNLTRNEDDFQELTIVAASLPDDVAARLYADLIEQTRNNPVVNPLVLQEYETLTGDPYTNRDATEKWIASQFDPEIIER